MKVFIDIEFYITPACEIMIKERGEAVRVLSETGKKNRDFITSFLDDMITFYPKAFKALSQLYSKKEPNRLNYEFWIVSRFIRCNFSEYDSTPDIDEQGRFNFEEVRCPIKCECPLSGIVCNPEFNTSLSFRETNVLRLIVQRHKISEISETLHISPHTASNHLRNIHIKTSTRTIADLVDYWHTYKLK